MKQNSSLSLDNGSRVAVIGGGPAGSFFSYFLLHMASRVEISLQVDIYERREFSALGPVGCNMCAGVISESLVQSLSVEGIRLPADVVQRGINSFLLHTDRESVTMYAPFREMRIATTYRGGGPKGAADMKVKSFDEYILNLAVSKGAGAIKERVTDLSWDGQKPQVHTKGREPRTYDLIVGAVGVNSPSGGLFEKLDFGYRKPKARKTFNMEFAFGSEFVTNNLGNAMHAFLLNLPGLEFAALIPKDNFVTMCLIGDKMDGKFVDSFMQRPPVQKYLSSNDSHTAGTCSCSPYASLGNATQPFGDRVVLIGDSGMSRLNKDGIGSAYRTAKVAAVTALFRGISQRDFFEGYWPICKTIKWDNRFGRVIYAAVEVVKRSRLLSRGVVRMIKSEQQKLGKYRRMSMVLWDMFTGSAPYRDVFIRCLHPAFIGGYIRHIVSGSGSSSVEADRKEEVMEETTMGRLYHDGEVIIREGETGDCMYVIQSGQSEVIVTREGKEVTLSVLGEGDVFGEMALFQQQPRSATVRAKGDMRILTIDKRIFLRRVHEDPSFAYLILQKMSQRIRELDSEMARLKVEAGPGIES
ncbi:MAG: cyclic nucleotide-binding domain-containing protein [Dehalococcoidales bacterium]|nr:cyclic nucleotide-binding domain-containing protein [Dehalococcoidales bacterium]